jgi:hypothetical protein
MARRGQVDILITAKDAASRVIRGTVSNVRRIFGDMKAGAQDALRPLGGLRSAMAQTVPGRLVTGVRAYFGAMVQGARAGFQSVGGLRGAFTGLARSINGIQPSLNTLLALGGLTAAYRKVADAANEYASSVRQLEGASLLVGAPLDFMQDLARKGREEFSLDAIEANRYATELTTLAAKAGDLRLAHGALNDVLNLGAAQGLKTAETMEMMARAADGDERSIKKLFNLKADQVFERFAASIGKTTDQLTDSEKALAFLTTMQEKGLLVQDQYAKFVASTEGKLDDAADAARDFTAEIGQQIGPLRELGANIFVNVLKGLNAFVKGMRLATLDFALLLVNIEAGLEGLNGAIDKFVASLIRRLPGAVQSALGLDVVAENLEKSGDRLLRRAAALRDAALSEGEKERQQIKNSGRPAPEVDQDEVDAANKRIQDEIKRREAALRRAQAAKEAQAALEAEIGLIDAKIKANKEDEQDMKRLSELEEEIQKKLEKKNLTLLEQLKLEQLLLNIQQTRATITERNIGENTSPRGNQVPGGSKPLEPGSQVPPPTDVPTNPEALPEILRGGRPDGLPAAEGIEQAITFTEEFVAVLNDAMAGPLADFFVQLTRGFEDLGDVVESFARAVAESMAQLASQLLASQILGAIFGAAVGDAGAGRVIGAGKKDGGVVRGPGGPRGDKILTPLSDGEGVITARAMKRVGKDGLDRINAMKDGGVVEKKPRYMKDGGVVEEDELKVRGMKDGGVVRGPGGPRDDKVLTALSDGEGVITARAMKEVGEAGLDYINSLGVPGSARSFRLNDSGAAGAAKSATVNGFIGVGLDKGLVGQQIRGELLTFIKENPRTIKRMLNL